MKKYSLFLIFLSFAYFEVYSQIINQDADGNSTIFYDGGSTGIDLLRLQASIAYNKSFNVGNSPRNLLAIGLNGRVKNEADFVGFIKSGNYNPKVDASFKIGGINYWGKYEIIDIVKTEKDAVEKRLEILREKITNDQYTKNDSLEYDSLSRKWTVLSAIGVKEYKKTKYQRITYYFEGNYSNTNTDIYNDTLATGSINSKIYARNYSNGSFMFGLNYEYNTLFIGTKLGFGTTTNLSILRPNEMTIVYNTDSLDNAVIQNSKTRNVYNQSEVRSFAYFGWDFDIIKFFPIKKDDKTQGTIVFDALYFRYGKYLSQNTNILNVGTSLNYFGNQGKFFGGLYLQLNNATNWPNESFDNKLQFGVVTKFNFVAIKNVFE